MERRIRLAVFDWAGTAVDFGSCGPAMSFVNAFAAFGVPVDMAEARAPMGLAKKEHIRTMLAAPALAHRWQVKMGRASNEDDVEALYRDVTPRQVEAASRLGAPVPGLLECVALLRNQSMKIAGTTGYFQAAADAAAATAAAHGYRPDVRVCADEVPTGRPAPWMMFRVMEATGVFPGWAVVKIGDTPVDMAEGRNAGAWCVGVLDSSNGMGLSRDDFEALPTDEKNSRRVNAAATLKEAGAHDTINHLGQLPALIAALNQRLHNGNRPT
jgi:phosphonoacetaldehyde hydrolase